MTDCLFASDLHGRLDRWEKLLGVVAAERPAAVFLGGDLFPGPIGEMERGRGESFLAAELVPRLRRLRDRLGERWTRLLAILGNDDGALVEEEMLALDAEGLLVYAHGRRVELDGGFVVLGYSFVPPTPFLLKDWERYDVSRFVDPGCISPEEGRRTRDVPPDELRWSTIAADLDRLAADAPIESVVLLAHSPPYRTRLDRAALDGRSIDHAPLDVHVGSIAIRRFIEERQPWLTLHGHVHESARLTGDWRDRIGRTWMFGAAHDGPELALVRFELEDPAAAARDLI